MPNDPSIAISDDRSEILSWLSPLEPHLRHHEIRTNRVEGVGDWLLRTGEFRRWKTSDGQGESQKATIFCSGNLGVGKTHISSLVIDTLCDEPRRDGEDIAVACFYFDSAAQKEQCVASVLGALLKQVIGSFKQIPKEITDAFQRHKKFVGGRKLQPPEIVKMLGSFSSTQRTFVCLDAIDECAAPDRANILLSLKDIIKASPTTRVFLTGRPHVDGEVEKYLSKGVEFVTISPRKGDILRYIHKKLAEDTTSGEMDERLEAEIVEKIPETVSGIFLLVSLNLDAILQETTIHRRRERLRAMTGRLGLEDVYGATLGRMKAQDGQKSRLGMAALMWICHSERPLGAQELCQALAIEIGSTDYNANNAPSMQTVLSCCQGLLIVGKEGSTARLVHYKLREYLTSHCNLFRNPHSTIAETCLTYLNSQQVMALSDSRVQSTQHSPFLAYSSLYWGTHMKKELTDRGKNLALKLLSRYECHVSIRLLLEHTLGRSALRSVLKFSKFTGLHCVCIFGLAEVLRALTNTDGIDINSVDETGATPLLWAAMSGHEEAVKHLLKRGDIDPDRTDHSGRTPMSWAAGNGREAVVKLLLGWKDASSDRPDPTLISLATQNKRAELLKLLLQPDGIDGPDSYGRTPISWAARNGQESVVKIFLERKDVDLDRPDKNGQTPISLAAKNGHEAVVKLLLAREDVNPDEPGVCGKTPILFAAENGHEAVVKLLLGRKDVDPDMSVGFGDTPISLAAENGHAPVVKLLLERKDVDAERETGIPFRRTPIHLAAANGHEAVVRLFLGRKDINPDRPGGFGNTPISLAAENGHEAVVKLLLGRKDVNPNRQAGLGNTPISLAAGNGHAAVVKLLLERKDVNPDEETAHIYCKTPIQLAAANGHEAVVRLLLGRKDLNLDRPGRFGKTAISLAAENGHEAIVKLLSGRESIDPSGLDL